MELKNSSPLSDSFFVSDFGGGEITEKEFDEIFTKPTKNDKIRFVKKSEFKISTERGDNMKTVKQEVDYAYEAYDGTIFSFKNCGGEEKAKEECKKYESSAKGVVAERLKDVLIRHPLKPIESNAVRSDGEILEAPDTFYFDESILSFFGFYNDCATCYIFAPKNQEDIDNFKQFAYLCGGEDIKNPERIKPGKLYFVAISSDIEATFINTLEECMADFEEALRFQLVRAKAFLNPDKYIYTKDEQGEFVFKER